MNFSFILYLLLLSGVVFVLPIIPLSLIFHVSGDYSYELTRTAQMLFIIFAVGVVSGIIQRAFLALQEGFVIAWIQIVARLISLGALLVAVRYEVGLPGLVFIVSGIFNVTLLICGLPLLFFRHSWLAPNRNFMITVDIHALDDLLRIGILGLGASIAVYFVNNSIIPIMSAKYGPQSVVDYALIAKLTNIPTLLLTYLLIPLWPAITDAATAEDIGWLKTIYRRYGLLTVFLSVSSFGFFLLFSRTLIYIWTNDNAAVPGYDILVASLVFMLIGFWNAFVSVFLNGLSKFKGQASYGLGLAVFFAVAAASMPGSLNRIDVIWVISLGYLIRCLVMQGEISRYFTQVSGRASVKRAPVSD
jgi:O-antigen/teichoic acid export membrane protein